MYRKVVRKIIQFFLTDYKLYNDVNIRLQRAILARMNKKIDLQNPITWEFSCFSQNGEDGIIDVLLDNIISEKNSYFIEIGCGGGDENNTTYLALVKKYAGLMIDGNKDAIILAKKVLSNLNHYVSCKHEFVTLELIKVIFDSFDVKDPDFFSLDIDGNDFHILKALLSLGFRPKVLAVEYNPIFGCTDSFIMAYNETFNVKNSTNAYIFGASILSWKKLMNDFGYFFITVEQSGTNAFFVNKNCFTNDFLNSINSVSYKQCSLYKNIKTELIVQAQQTGKIVLF